MDSFFRDFASSPETPSESQTENLNFFDFDLPDPSLTQLYGMARESDHTETMSPMNTVTEENNDRKSKPFKIIREGSTEKSDLKEVSRKSKKIQKYPKEKEKDKISKDLEYIRVKASDRYIPEGITNPNLDIRTQRRMIQAVKNRIAAQETRDKRKAYIKELEAAKADLEDFNQDLLEKNKIMEEKLRALEEEKIELLAQNEELKRREDISQYLSTDRRTEGSNLGQERENEAFLYSTSPQLIRVSPHRNFHFYSFLGLIVIFAVLTFLKASTRNQVESGQYEIGFAHESSEMYDLGSKLGEEGDNWGENSEYEHRASSNQRILGERWQRIRLKKIEFETESSFIEEQEMVLVETDMLHFEI